MQALTRVNPRVYDSVAALCDSPNTTVVVFSGSDKQKLEETFGKLNVWLAAENGIFMRPPGGEWSTLLEVRHLPSADPWHLYHCPLWAFLFELLTLPALDPIVMFGKPSGSRESIPWHKCVQTYCCHEAHNANLASHLRGPCKSKS